MVRLQLMLRTLWIIPHSIDVVSESAMTRSPRGSDESAKDITTIGLDHRNRHHQVVKR
jgi:hypothetical protein